jgi:hypothetical protein
VIGVPPSDLDGFHAKSTVVSVRLENFNDPSGADGLSVIKTKYTRILFLINYFFF